MLLSNARVELQVLNERWKQAEEARLNQSAEAAVLRQELKTMQANVDTLETEKGTVYAELKSFQDKCKSLHAELVTAQGREHQGSLRCSALMAEKADAEDRLATLEKESQALQASHHTILDDTDDTLDQQLQEVSTRLEQVQDERQQLWAHISQLQLAATDAEQVRNVCVCVCVCMCARVCMIVSFWGKTSSLAYSFGRALSFTFTFLCLCACVCVLCEGVMGFGEWLADSGVATAAASSLVQCS
jgi:small-conductance mechanosensitive channel